MKVRVISLLIFKILDARGVEFLAFIIKMLKLEVKI